MKEHGEGNDTWGRLWNMIIVTFRSLYYGVHPIRDADGDEWPDGSPQALLAGNVIAEGKYVAMIWHVARDAAYACNELRVTHYAAKHACCAWCPANRTTINYRDVSEGAVWRPLVFTPRNPGPQWNHQVWRILTYMTMFHYMGGW